MNGSIYLEIIRDLYLPNLLSLYLGLWSNPINGGFNVLVATSSTQLADLEKDHATQEALHSALPLLIQESDPKLIKLYILSHVFSIERDQLDVVLTCNHTVITWTKINCFNRAQPRLLVSCHKIQQGFPRRRSTLQGEWLWSPSMRLTASPNGDMTFDQCLGLRASRMPQMWGSLEGIYMGIYPSI